MAAQANGERTTSQRRGEDEPDRQPRAQEQERVLVLEADPGHHAHRQPEATVAACEQLHHQPQDDRPGEQVGIGGGVEVARGRCSPRGPP